MPTRDNQIMLEAGYVTATQIARALRKSLPTVHKLVRDARMMFVLEGAVMYVHLAHIERHYAGNPPMLAAVKTLRTRRRS
jgi:hypothetical protein